MMSFPLFSQQKCFRNKLYFPLFLFLQMILNVQDVPDSTWIFLLYGIYIIFAANRIFIHILFIIVLGHLLLPFSYIRSLFLVREGSFCPTDYYRLTFLDRRIAAGMPSSRGEDWQPLLMYRNSLVHGETDQPPVTSKRAYGRKKKEHGAGYYTFNLSVHSFYIYNNDGIIIVMRPK